MSELTAINISFVIGTNGDKMNNTEERINTKNVQNKIKYTLSLIGWSVPKFASAYLIEQSDTDIPESDMKSFIEKIKKQLSRSTTKSALLINYLRYIEKTVDYSKHRARS